MAGTFSVSITTIASTTSSFGETKSSERSELVYLLQQVAQAVGSGRPSVPIVDRMGNSVGTYTYGAGMINAGA
jgi:hypothetical protein